jgi:hypothetical protein
MVTCQLSVLRSLAAPSTASEVPRNPSNPLCKLDNDGTALYRDTPELILNVALYSPHRAEAGRLASLALVVVVGQRQTCHAPYAAGRGSPLDGKLEAMQNRNEVCTPDAMHVMDVISIKSLYSHLHYTQRIKILNIKKGMANG